MSRVLFVCVANSGRSVMAERLFRRAAGARHEARSAGSAPGTAVHPVVLDALTEVGIDASDHVPHGLDDGRVAWAEVVVATCDDACPVIPGKRYVSWNLPDPMGRPLGEVRAIRDDIARRVEELVGELDDARPKEEASWSTGCSSAPTTPAGRGLADSRPGEALARGDPADPLRPGARVRPDAGRTEHA